MVTVLLYGPEKDTQMAEVLLAAIRSAGCCALHMKGKMLSMIPPGADTPDFLIIDSEIPPELQVGKVILIFKQNHPNIYQHIEISNDYIAVLDSSDAGAKKMLEKSGMQAVTCGMSQKDTVTFSSIKADNAVIWVQRELQALDGSSIEPQELPVILSKPVGDYPLLASIAVLLLCGLKLSQEDIKLNL